MTDARRMPSKETEPMNERVKFIAAYLEHDEPFFGTCERFGISRKTGYKWVERYEGGGVAALEEVVSALVAARKKHPRWGPRKLLVVVHRQRPDLELPAASTVGDILRKRGLIGRKRRIRRSSPYAERLGGYEVQTPSGAPTSRATSRYRAHVVIHSQSATASPDTFFAARRCRVRSPSRRARCSSQPFGSTECPRRFGATTVLPSRRWHQAGCPASRSGGFAWASGPNESRRDAQTRMVATNECAARSKRKFASLRALAFAPQQRAFDEFQTEYNDVRPHEALGQATPSSLYQPSLRECRRSTLSPMKAVAPRFRPPLVS